MDAGSDVVSVATVLDMGGMPQCHGWQGAAYGVSDFEKSKSYNASDVVAVATVLDMGGMPRCHG